MRHVIFALLVLGAVVSCCWGLGGCRTTPSEPVVITKTVDVPVPVPCPDKRAAAPDVPTSMTDLKTRLAKEPDAVARVQALLAWAPLWMERISEDNGQIAACVPKA